MIKFYKENYYRSQFVRDSFLDLNGKWKFLFDDENKGEKDGYYLSFPNNNLTINVPYSYECAESLINDQKHHNVVWYERNINVNKLENSQRFIINFEGSDYQTKLWVNGQYIGIHNGGYCRFSFDITDKLVDGDNKITVRVYDSKNIYQLRGKQRWIDESFGCWYIQTSGIWKPVWAEIVSETRIDYVKTTPLIDKNSVRFDYEINNYCEGLELETIVSFEDLLIRKEKLSITDRICFNELDIRCNKIPFDLKLWTPGEPNLYDVEFVLYKDGKIIDRVGSYFGLRKIEARDKTLKLNNASVYLKLVLAQNYWDDTGYTMKDISRAKKDISIVKECGFNGLRIHQKVEDERFLTLCDMNGLFVWSEIPSPYGFSDETIINYTSEYIEAIRQQYNHPSIIVWVNFNESWGVPNIASDVNQQMFTQGIYGIAKAFDCHRPVINNDGWEHTDSDIITLHDYDYSAAKINIRYKDNLVNILENRVAHGQYKFAFANGYQYHDQPIIISEYGGIALAGSDGWGYNEKASNAESLIKKYEELTMAIKKMDNVCGYCYTQLSDVYQEINGIVDMKRNPKFDFALLKEINDR